MDDQPPVKGELDDLFIMHAFLPDSACGYMLVAWFAQNRWAEPEWDKVAKYYTRGGPIRYCHHCHTCLEVDRGKKCARCLEARYCNRECQKAHWPQHKLTCHEDTAEHIKSNMILELPHNQPCRAYMDWFNSTWTADRPFFRISTIDSTLYCESWGMDIFKRTMLSLSIYGHPKLTFGVMSLKGIPHYRWEFVESDDLPEDLKVLYKAGCLEDDTPFLRNGKLWASKRPTGRLQCTTWHD